MAGERTGDCINGDVWTVPVLQGDEASFPEPVCSTTNSEQGTSYLHYRGYDVAMPLYFASEEQAASGDVLTDPHLADLSLSVSGSGETGIAIGTWQCLQLDTGIIVTEWKDTSVWPPDLLALAGFTWVHQGNWGNPHLSEDVQLMALSVYFEGTSCEEEQPPTQENPCDIVYEGVTTEVEGNYGEGCNDDPPPCPAYPNVGIQAHGGQEEECVEELEPVP
jgi:hypothetical protein